MTAPPARIACLDLDTFFVSVERLFDPSLVGKPVVVGAVGNRGVVTSASYEVRPLGVRSGMSIVEARKLAPHAIYLPGRHDAYGPLAAKVKAVLERYTPVVQTASIDEFFLDFRGCEAYWRRACDTDEDATIVRVNREMREAVFAETGLPASIGVGATRSIAKMASGRAKPAGVCFVGGGAEPDFVADLPVRRFPGIGPVAEAALVAAGVFTLGQLARPTAATRGAFPGHVAAVAAAVFPTEARHLGRDRPAFQEHDPDGEARGTLSNERTFFDDLGDDAGVHAQLRALADRVAWRARKRGVKARTVHLKLRYRDFETLTRSSTGPPTDDPRVVLARCQALFDAARTRPLSIRLLGVGLSNLVGGGPQLRLPLGGRPTMGSAVDAVRARFGFDAIRLGATSSGAER